MNILALETSCEQASVALWCDGQTLEHTLEGHSNHSEHVLQSVSSLLAEAGVRLSQLDAIAFGSGPGAFTGLRLSCGVAQGLAMGSGLGVVAIPSLLALGAQAPDGAVLVATDARMGEIYTLRARVMAGRPEAEGAFECMPPEAFCIPEGQEWFLVGSAFARYPALCAVPCAGVRGVKADAVPRAHDVAQLAALEVEAGRVLAPELAAPLYVRDKVALTTAERLARGGRA